MAGRSNLYDFRKRSGNSVALSAGSRRDGLGLERSLGCAAALSGLLLFDKMSLRILVGAEEVSDLLGKSSLKLLLKIDQLLLKHKACYYKSHSGNFENRNNYECTCHFCFLLTEKSEHLFFLSLIIAQIFGLSTQMFDFFEDLRRFAQGIISYDWIVSQYMPKVNGKTTTNWKTKAIKI